MQVLRVAIVFAVICCAAPAQAGSLLGVSWDGTVSQINETDGTGSTVGQSGFGGVNALARNSAGQFIAVSHSILDPASTAFAINPTTGVGNAPTTLDFGQAESSVRGLTFAQGTLYAINNGGGRFSTTGPDDLYVIDLATGQASLIGNTGFVGIQALTTGPGGQLYGWDVGTSGLDGSGLLLLDPATGAAADLDSTIGETDGVDIQTLAFSPEGKLYGGKDALYLIDPASGSTTLVGSGGYSDVRGFEFFPASQPQDPAPRGSDTEAAPEPSSLILLGFGLLGSSLRLRQRRLGQ
jgi:hypothetical protein